MIIEVEKEYGCPFRAGLPGEAAAAPAAAAAANPGGRGKVDLVD